MRKLLLIGLVLLLISCKSKKVTADSPTRFTIENLAASSAEDLRKIFPDAEMTDGTDMFEEGTAERPFSILYPGTEKEMLITWNDSARTEIHRIRIEGDGPWKSETGVEIGTTYEELKEMNGPFDFYGFGWDYSGAVDWNGGELADSDIRVFLAPKETPPNKYYGDQIIEATEEEIAALELTVQAIILQKN